MNQVHHLLNPTEFAEREAEADKIHHAAHKRIHALTNITGAQRHKQYAASDDKYVKIQAWLEAHRAEASLMELACGTTAKLRVDKNFGSIDFGTCHFQPLILQLI